jgi:hypothetical protein
MRWPLDNADFRFNLPQCKALQPTVRVSVALGLISLRGKQVMRAPKLIFAITSVFALGCAGLFISASASAYTVCNGNGDCWHTDTRVHFPDVTLSFHNDKWADAHRSDAKYHWHEADADHDSAHGYWANGEWHHE